MNSFDLTIVNQEKQVYCGKAVKLFVTSVNGELEILAGHTRLLAQLAPAPVWIEKPDQTREALVIFGGVIEVQPNKCIILADTVVRAADLDEIKILKAKRDAEQILKQKHHTSIIDYNNLLEKIAFAKAQLRVIKYLSSKKR